MPATDQNTVYVAVVIAILGFMIGFAKGGFSGLGALLTPILALVLPVAFAVGVLLPMLMVGDVFAVTMYWKEWDLDLVKRMLPAGIIGALAGTFLLSSVSPEGLRLILGIFVLGLVAYKFLSDRIQAIRYEPRSWHAPAAGFLAGIASGMFNSGGPSFNSYLLFKSTTVYRHHGDLFRVAQPHQSAGLSIYRRTQPAFVVFAVVGVPVYSPRNLGRPQDAHADQPSRV